MKNDVNSVRTRLMSMRDRIRKQIGDQVDDIYEATHKDGDGAHLHTHNADMDAEGVDEAVGLSHAFEQRLRTIDGLLHRLDAEGESLLNDERERAHIEALLETEDFAQNLRAK